MGGGGGVGVSGLGFRVWGGGGGHSAFGLRVFKVQEVLGLGP